MLTVESRTVAAADHGPPDGSQAIRLVDSFEDGAVFHLDLTGRVIGWNAGAERVFGIGGGLGPSDCSFLLRATESGSAETGPPLRAALSKGQFRIAGWRVRADGTWFRAHVVITPLLDHAGRAFGFLAVVRDVTDRRRRLGRLHAALDISRAVMGEHPLARAVELVARHAQSLLHADGAHVTLSALGSRRPVISAAEGWNSRHLQAARWPARRSLAASAEEPARPGLADDALPARRGPGRMGPMLAVPLARRGRRVGTLLVYNRVGGPAFRRKDLAVLRRFAGHAALAIEHADRHRGQRRIVARERARLARVAEAGAVRSLSQVCSRLRDAISGCHDRVARERLTTCAVTIEGAIDDIRSCVFGRRPRILADHRLDEALRLLAHDLDVRTGLTTTVEMQPDAAERLTEHAGDVIQLVREALSNVSRHARAQHCRLSLRAADSGGTQLEIEDDGRGFDPCRVPDRRDGLRNLRERVVRMGGQLRIETGPGEGTAVRIAIPVGGRSSLLPGMALAHARRHAAAAAGTG